MILACQNISKSFGTDVILKDINFHIEQNEKAAIVGINGAGKSTLLKIIMGEETADSGEVVLAKDKTIGYLAQYQDVSGHRTIYDEVLNSRPDILGMEQKIRDMESEMNALTGDALNKLLDTYHRITHEFELVGGYAYRSEVSGIIRGLGFCDEEFDKKMDELSGGQKTRVCLGKLLVTKPDVLLLDEPTNHLDMESIAWLENYLLNYRGAVVIVAHDRYFLDRIVTKVVEIYSHKSYVYNGNYTDYAQKKAKIREDLLKQYYNNEREIKRQEEVIAKLKSFNREKSIKRAESREKMLGRMERIEKPIEENTDIRMVLEPNILSGNDVLTAEHLAKSYPPLTLFSDLSFEIKRGEKVALIGNNGTGKTTILKMINGLVDGDAGTITLGANVHIGYYDQEHALLNMDNTIFDEISDAYPDLTQTKIRNVLAAFLFTNDDVFKRIGDISGGERGRVSLAKLMLSDANFLILDEPTNHLDITSKEILENALNKYSGTVFYVSHDRYFINQTATRILELSGEELNVYLGNYDYYLKKRDERAQAASNNPVVSAGLTQSSQDNNAGKMDWQEQKAEQARIRKLENDIKKIEDEISRLEEILDNVETQMADPANVTNSAKLNELTAEQNEAQVKLDECFDIWEKLSLERDAH
jgi:ATP-binding cassette subfamily F protein 3